MNDLPVIDLTRPAEPPAQLPPGTRMPVAQATRGQRIALLAGVLVVLWLTLQLFDSILLPFVAAAGIAYVLDPFCTPLARARVPRGLAALLLVLLVSAATILFAWMSPQHLWTNVCEQVSILQSDFNDANKPPKTRTHVVITKPHDVAPKVASDSSPHGSPPEKPPPDVAPFAVSTPLATSAIPAIAPPAVAVNPNPPANLVPVPGPSPWHQSCRHARGHQSGDSRRCRPAGQRPDRARRRREEPAHTVDRHRWSRATSPHPRET